MIICIQCGADERDDMVVGQKVFDVTILLPASAEYLRRLRSVIHLRFSYVILDGIFRHMMTRVRARG